MACSWNHSVNIPASVLAIRAQKICSPDMASASPIGFRDTWINETLSPLDLPPLSSFLVAHSVITLIIPILSALFPAGLF